MPTGSARRLGIMALATLGLARLAACGSPTEVGISAVRVSPDSADVVAGDETRLQATILDSNDAEVTGTTPEWSSADPTVATVDEQGLVTARLPGTVTIRASAAGASGSARIRVLAAPTIALSESSVRIAVGAGGSPALRTVAVGNGGAGSVGQLSARVIHPAGVSSWLSATLAGHTAPTTLTLTADPGGLTTGGYTASVEITSSEAAVPPAQVSVTLTLTSLRVEETAGATEVTEAGGTDQVLVSLSAAPATSVVLDVSSDAASVSASPTRLTFPPGSWDVPQAVTLTGVDDATVEGAHVSLLTIAVDTAASDGDYDGVPSASVSVTIVDDDVAGLALSATGGSTRVHESGSTDEVLVVLTAQPLTDVEVVVDTDDPSEVSLAPTRLTFTSTSWSTPQAVTVTGVDDSLVDGPQDSEVTARVDASTSDDAFDAVQERTLTVTTDDDDGVPGVSQATPTGHPDVPADQLVASYDLTTLTPAGLLHDFSGRALHGTISGTTVIASPRGGARLFQQAPQDRIELPPRSDFDLDGPLSIVARVRMDRQRRHQHIVACDDKFALAIREADQVRLSNTRGDLAETLDPLSPNVWHSIVAVFRGTAGDVLDDTNIEIWIDGVRAALTTRNATGTPPVVWRDGVLHASDACYIGFESHQGDPGHQTLAFHGAIDEIVIFGRALTQTEIQLLGALP